MKSYGAMKNGWLQKPIADAIDEREPKARPIENYENNVNERCTVYVWRGSAKVKRY